MFYIKCVGLIVLLNSATSQITKTDTWFEYCDHLVPLGRDSSLYINSPFYPQKYPPKSSCRYVITAPLDYEINIQCNIDFDKISSDCDSEHFLVSTEGARNLTHAEYFCGKGYIQRKSFFHTLAIAYTSSSRNKTGGLFSCLIQTQQQSCDCGWTIPPNEVSAASGNEVKFNEYPMLAGVISASSKRLLCSGTIVSHRYVMTAASCFSHHTSPTDILIRAGDYNLITEKEDPLDGIYTVSTIIQHPGYDHRSGKNDIALVLTKSDIEWSLGVGPACLPLYFSVNSFADEPAETVVWSTSQFTEPPSYLLRKVFVNVTQCTVTYSGLDDSQICTSSATAEEACVFDAGAALMKRTERLYAIGVTGAASSCGLPSPKVHTRVTSHLNWIRSIVGDELCRK